MANEELFQSSRRDEPPKRFFLEGRNPETGLWRLVDASGTVRVEAQGMFDLQPPIGEEVGYVPGPIPTAVWHQRRPFEQPSFEEETLQPALFFVYGVKTPEFYEIRSFAPNTNKSFLLARLDRYVNEVEIYLNGVKSNTETSFSRSESAGSISDISSSQDFLISNVDTNISSTWNGSVSDGAAVSIVTGNDGLGTIVKGSIDGLLDTATGDMIAAGLGDNRPLPIRYDSGQYIGSVSNNPGQTSFDFSPLSAKVAYLTHSYRIQTRACHQLDRRKNHQVFLSLRS